MKKFLTILCVLLLSVQYASAYAIRLYDEYGNRIGTYRKEGDNYVLYDFYDNKVENPEDLIKNAPSQKTLKQTTDTFYNENFIPIGTFSTGLYQYGNIYYPIRNRHHRYYHGNFGAPPPHFHHHQPYMVRPGAKSLIRISL